MKKYFKSFFESFTFACVTFVGATIMFNCRKFMPNSISELQFICCAALFGVGLAYVNKMVCFGTKSSAKSK